MIEKLNKIVKASKFKYWVALEREFGYSKKSKGALKARVHRAIKFLDKSLNPLGFKITIEKL